MNILSPTFANTVENNKKLTKTKSQKK